ncbi:hypothetical protein [Flagellimonas sp. S3867]|uniref:hypothetical protein n=1 Tax=Flagellimonas sp. S3867 TaxID=2768063 RepID=UPI001683B8DD|nr:hypothetical protein [Flagellimonas sp. S3867]
MKALVLPISLLLLLIATSCLNFQESPNGIDDATYGSSDGSFFGMFQNAKRPHAFKDVKTGLTTKTMQFPTEWNVVSRPVYKFDVNFPSFLYQIQNENGLIAFNSETERYYNYSDPYYKQLMSQQGQQISPVIPLENIANGELVPLMGRYGFDFLQIREIPELYTSIAQKLQRLGMGHYGYNMLATEWASPQNEKALIIMHQIVMNSDASMSTQVQIWTYEKHFMVSSNNSFEKNVAQFVAASVGEVEGKKWKQYRDYVVQQKQRQSQVEHENRMRDRWNNFNAHQQKMRNISTAMDASQARFLQNLNGNTNYGSSGNNHRNFLNMINGEETVTNADGQQYQVKAGAEHYWMSSDGKYIMTDDNFYNANGDMNLNHQEWYNVSPNN